MGRFSRAAVGLLLTGGLAGLAGCSESATITVTTTADVVADDGLTSLREAFAEASTNDFNDTIVLTGSASYDLTDCADGALDHTSSRRLTIAGGGATIRQTCADAGIVSTTKSPSALVVESTRLVGGPNSGVDLVGAGISAEGTLRLIDSTVTGVDAGPGGTVIEGSPGRGEYDVFISGSTISDSTGTALRISDGVVRMAGVITGIDGDGVRLVGNSLFITPSDAPGAIISDTTGWGVNATGSASLDLSNSEIDRNGLGGVSCAGCFSTFVNATSVSGNGTNAAAGSGGGVVFTVNQNGGTSQLHVSGSTISGNRAQRAGGGLFVGVAESTEPAAQATSVRIEGTTVSGNATTGDGRPGGGVAVTTGDLLLLDSHIDDNVAAGTGSDGGGLYYHEADDGVPTPFTYTDVRSTFTGNEAGGRGGGAFFETTGGFGTTSTYTSNTAAGQGGGVYAAAPLASLYQADFVSNTAGAQGGGAYLLAPAYPLMSQFSSNQATEGGGLHLASADPAADSTVAQSSFVGNVATVRGGGVATDGVHQVDLANVTFSGNAAPRGGGLWLGPDADLVTLSYVTMSDNSAPVGSTLTGDGGSLRTLASLLVRPLGGGASCAIDPADVTSEGHSFLADAGCAPGPDDTVSAADPLLGPVAPGDHTLFRAPQAASPVGGTVPVAVCDGQIDQNGTGRPQGAACEPGAVEVVEGGP